MMVRGRNGARAPTCRSNAIDLRNRSDDRREAAERRVADAAICLKVPRARNARDGWHRETGAPQRLIGPDLPDATDYEAEAKHGQDYKAYYHYGHRHLLEARLLVCRTTGYRTVLLVRFASESGQQNTPTLCALALKPTVPREADIAWTASQLRRDDLVTIGGGELCEEEDEDENGW